MGLLQVDIMYIYNLYNGDIMYLIGQVTSRDHLTQRACEFMGENSLCYVTTLITFVTISIVMVEMFLICHVTSCEHI